MSESYAPQHTVPIDRLALFFMDDERVEEYRTFCQNSFGYCPKIEFEGIDGRLVFQSEMDSVIFRLRFSESIASLVRTIEDKAKAAIAEYTVQA